MEQSQKQQKKVYSPPKLTEHGDAIEQTRGFGGRFWEYYSPQSSPIIFDPPTETDD